LIYKNIKERLLKMMKKILSLVLMVMLVISMTACAKDKATSDTPASEDTGNAEVTESAGDSDTTDVVTAAPTEAPAAADFTGKKLTVGIWAGNDAETAALAQVVSDFQTKTGATVELKTYTDINTQIQADFIAGTAPDVFYVDANMFPFYATLDVMQELDPAEMGTDAYYANLMKAFTTEDGKIYAVPKDMSTLAM
jgi:multiple sugar transport system substrate-binding protein